MPGALAVGAPDQIAGTDRIVRLIPPLPAGDAERNERGARFTRHRTIQGELAVARGHFDAAPPIANERHAAAEQLRLRQISAASA